MLCVALAAGRRQPYGLLPWFHGLWTLLSGGLHPPGQQFVSRPVSFLRAERYGMCAASGRRSRWARLSGGASSDTVSQHSRRFPGSVVMRVHESALLSACGVVECGIIAERSCER